MNFAGESLKPTPSARVSTHLFLTGPWRHFGIYTGMTRYTLTHRQDLCFFFAMLHFNCLCALAKSDGKRWIIYRTLLREVLSPYEESTGRESNFSCCCWFNYIQGKANRERYMLDFRRADDLQGKKHEIASNPKLHPPPRRGWKLFGPRKFCEITIQCQIRYPGQGLPSCFQSLFPRRVVFRGIHSCEDLKKIDKSQYHYGLENFWYC